MARWCLTKNAEAKLLEALKKEGDPQKMVDRGTEGRQKWFAQFGEDNAKNLNALFESKMLLKSQQRGLASFVKSLGGSKQIKTDFLSKVNRLETALSKSEVDQYLGDYTAKRLGMEAVTEEQFKTISDLSGKVTEAEQTMNPDFTFSSKTAAKAYGEARATLKDYADMLKNTPTGVHPIKGILALGKNSKSIRASTDHSAIFRQGWKTLWTHPLYWSKNAIKSTAALIKTFGKDNVMHALNADFFARRNFNNNYYKRAKLAIGVLEEDFPGSFAEKIPGIGKVYKASENAFTVFVQRQRADIFDKYIQIAEKRGKTLDDKELQAIGSMVNSLTGRASLPGDLERAAGVFNNVFFSPRKFIADINTFMHPITGAGGSNFVRREAAINMLKIITGTAAVLATANAVRPRSVEKDPRSANFGKIKVGNTRFDVTGGISPIITLASRLLTMSSKSSITGEVSPINSGKYGATTGKDLVFNFLENKLSPIASVAKDLLEQKTFQGTKPTLPGELENLFVPLSISNYKELSQDPNSANILLATIADALGLGTNTYGKSVKDWTQQPTKEQSSFQEKVGTDKFKQANTDFNKSYDEWFSKTSETSTYKNLSDDGKQKAITAAKSTIQDKIFKKYGFVYKEPKKTSEQVKESATVKSLKPK